MMALSCGRVAWTTLCARGTSERGGSCSNMISPLRSVSHLFLSCQQPLKNWIHWNCAAFCFMYRSSHWATAQRVSGWLWAWRAAMWRCSTTPSQTSISSICMRAVCCLSNSPTVVRHQAILGLPCLCEPRVHWWWNGVGRKCSYCFMTWRFILNLKHHFNCMFLTFCLFFFFFRFKLFGVLHMNCIFQIERNLDCPIPLSLFSVSLHISLFSSILPWQHKQSSNYIWFPLTR